MTRTKRNQQQQQQQQQQMRQKNMACVKRINQQHNNIEAATATEGAAAATTKHTAPSTQAPKQPIQARTQTIRINADLMGQPVLVAYLAPRLPVGLADVTSCMFKFMHTADRIIEWIEALAVIPIWTITMLKTRNKNNNIDDTFASLAFSLSVLLLVPVVWTFNNSINKNTHPQTTRGKVAYIGSDRVVVVIPRIIDCNHHGSWGGLDGLGGKKRDEKTPTEHKQANDFTPNNHTHRHVPSFFGSVTRTMTQTHNPSSRGG
jgi:hypothetical protein